MLARAIPPFPHSYTSLSSPATKRVPLAFFSEGWALMIGHLALSFLLLFVFSANSVLSVASV